MTKEIFEAYLREKSDLYFSEKNTLNDAIRYSLLADGKRIRPLLCLGFSQGLGGKKEIALAAGMSVEMIHAYSLIHDDLPAMDNDDFRRGVPTNHKVYGEATAILAGDSLLNLAPEFLMKELKLLAVDPGKTLELTTLLLKASGHEGMVKGQALDMEYETKDLSSIEVNELQKVLKDIHRLKTGSIIKWSCIAGLYSHADENKIRSSLPLVEKIGEDIGLLFQIVDDVLDVTSNLKELGKTPGKDAVSGKLTYTTLYGLEESRTLAHNLIHSLHEDLQKLGTGDWSLIESIINRLKNSL